MILIHPNKLSAYSDEISDDPVAACELARTYGLQTVCLRKAWSQPVVELSPEALRLLKGSLGGLRVLLLTSELGLDSLEPSDEQFNKPFLVANYFGARFLKIHVGNIPDPERLKNWMERVANRALSASLVPVLEYQIDSGYWSPQELLKVVEPFRRWRLLYDPAQFIIRRNLNPFEQYWQPLKKHIALVELRDFQIGVGFRPAGHGDSKLAETIRDANLNSLPIYYILEHGLGRNYGKAVGRTAVFKLAYDCMNDKL